MTDTASTIRSFMMEIDVPLSLADARGADMPLVAVNAAFEALTGFTSEEIVGRNCRFLQTDKPQNAEREEIHSILAGKRDGQVVLENARADGKVFDNLLFLAPIFEGGALAYFLGSQFEVPRERAVEEAQERGQYLRRHLNRLQRESRDLTTETRRLTARSIALRLQSLI